MLFFYKGGTPAKDDSEFPPGRREPCPTNLRAPSRTLSRTEFPRTKLRKVGATRRVASTPFLRTKRTAKIQTGETTRACPLVKGGTLFNFRGFLLGLAGIGGGRTGRMGGWIEL